MINVYFKNFVLITIVLAILTVSTVSAENITVNVGSDGIVDNINVTFPQNVYEKDLGEISVDLPHNTSGNLKAKISDIEIYNENISASVKIPISIPEDAYPSIFPNKITDHTTFGLYLFFNDIEIKSNHTLNVMKYPKNFTTPVFPDEILKDDEKSHVSLFFPESADGGAEIYIDGKLSDVVNTTSFTFLNVTEFISLPLGNHTVGIKYNGDSYYRPFYKNFTFGVVDMLISIPQNMLLDHDDCITAKVLNNSDGILTIYVDNQPVFSDKLDVNGEFLHSMFYNITCGTHLVEVHYNASNFTKSKKVMVNVTYNSDISIWSHNYGGDNVLIIIVPSDFNKSLIKIKINNTEYKNFEIDNNGWIEIDVSNLKPGNYSARVDLLDGEKYYNMSLDYNFTINHGFISIRNVNSFYSQNAKIKVLINGNNAINKYVTFKIGKNTFKVKTNSEGIATLKTSALKIGKYVVAANYAGLKTSKTLTIKHLISLNTIKVKKSTKKVTLKIKLAKNLKNKLITFKFNGKKIKSKTNKNGVAKAVFKIKNIKKGKRIAYSASYLKDMVKKTVVVK